MSIRAYGLWNSRRCQNLRTFICMATTGQTATGVLFTTTAPRRSTSMTCSIVFLWNECNSITNESTRDSSTLGCLLALKLKERSLTPQHPVLTWRDFRWACSIPRPRASWLVPSTWVRIITLRSCTPCWSSTVPSCSELLGRYSNHSSMRKPERRFRSWEVNTRKNFLSEWILKMFPLSLEESVSVRAAVITLIKVHGRVSRVIESRHHTGLRCRR